MSRIIQIVEVQISILSQMRQGKQALISKSLDTSFDVKRHLVHWKTN